MIFNSPEHALRFAFEITNRPIVKVSSINAMRGAEKRSSDDLTPYDRHAQAAMILGLCERVLPSLHMAYVQAQFGRDRSGFDLLAQHIACNLGTGLHSRRGIEQIIRAYCGEKGGLREIKKSMSTGLLKAASMRNRGYDALDAIHNQAMDTLWGEMQGRALIATGTG